jgi:TMEM175 potassium channel family protein
VNRGISPPHSVRLSSSVCGLGRTKETYISAPLERPNGGETDTGRTISFSDAVIAIAITLLALDLKVPQVPESSAASELPSALVELWPNLFSFALSFWIIGSYWLAHRRISEVVSAYDSKMQLINLLFLMWVVLMPFSTTLLGEYEHQQLPVVIYAVHNILTSLTLAWLWRHAARDSSLLEANLDPRLVRHSTFRALIVQSVFVLSIGISFVSVDVARLSWLLIWPLTGPLLQRYV